MTFRFWCPKHGYYSSKTATLGNLLKSLVNYHWVFGHAHKCDGNPTIEIELCD